ncbi:MAG: hypothetical protein FWC57_05240, partial [Endomicrobia bacterium]|nr:hypothetical protein [Endomicrobiia bacterium]
RIVSSSEDVKNLAEKDLGIANSLVIVENMDEAERLQKQGFNAAVVVKKTGRSLGGVVLTDGDENKIGKVKMSEIGGIMLFDVRLNNENTTLEEIKAAIEKSVSEGVWYEKLKARGITQVIISDNNSVSEVSAKMRNVERDRNGNKTKEAALYLNDRKEPVNNLEEFCKNEYKTNGIGVYVINPDSYPAADIKELRKDGIRFVFAVKADEVSESMEFSFDGAMIDAASIANVNDAKTLLEKLVKAKNAAGNSYGLRITVKFSENILSELAKEYDAKKYSGIMLVTKEGSAYNGSLGKMEVAADAINDKLLENSNVGAIGSAKEETFANNKEQRKEKKSAKEQFERGEKAAWGNKFEDRADITNTELVGIITSLTPDSANFEEKITEFANKANNGLTAQAQSYLKHLVEKGRYAEALGFIRGAALNSVAEEWNSMLDKKGINADIVKQNDKVYRTGLIKALQLVLAGKTLSEISDEEMNLPYADAKSYIDAIMSSVNADMENTLFENEYTIKKLGEKDVPAAITAYNNFNVFLQENFRKQAAEKIKISTTFAVRSILSAA